MCQGLSHFSGVLHHFVLGKLATSSITINKFMPVSAKMTQQLGVNNLTGAFEKDI